MKRRNFVKTSALTTLTAMAATSAASAKAVRENPSDEEREIYELRVYTMKFGGPQGQLHDYLKSALIPALNAAGVKKVGVFREMADPNPTKIYLFIPYNSMSHMAEVLDAVGTNNTYQEAAETYRTLPVDRQVYLRYDTWLLRAFAGIPQMKLPESKKRVLELRTYEGYSEDAVSRKVDMFNEVELDIFYKTKLNPVFFGHMLAGPNMPALTYMLWFKDIEERDKNWKDFINHPEWKKVSKLPEYANTVSNIIRVFLKPTDYSQV